MATRWLLGSSISEMMGKSSWPVPGLGPELGSEVFLKVARAGPVTGSSSAAGMSTLLLFLASLLLVLGASWGEPMNTVLELLTELELCTPDTGTLRTALLV